MTQYAITQYLERLNITAKWYLSLETGEGAIRLDTVRRGRAGFLSSLPLLRKVAQLNNPARRGTPCDLPDIAMTYVD